MSTFLSAANDSSCSLPRIQRCLNPASYSQAEFGHSLSFPFNTPTFLFSVYSLLLCIKKKNKQTNKQKTTPWKPLMHWVPYQCFVYNGVYWKGARVLPSSSFHSSGWMKEEGWKQPSGSIFIKVNCYKANSMLRTNRKGALLSDKSSCGRPQRDLSWDWSLRWSHLVRGRSSTKII